MKRVEYLVEKLDRFANKIGKHNVMLVSFITVVLLITGLYSTFSLFTSSEGIHIIDGLTTFTAKATNTTENPINFKGVDIHVKGDIEVTLGAHGFSVINPGETLELINYSDVDLEKATEITYSVVY